MANEFWNAYSKAADVRFDRASRQAGGMMAGGDLAGARNVLYQSGNLQDGVKLDEQLGVQRKAKAEAAERWAQGLDKMMKDPRFASNPEAAYQAAMPFAERLGLSPQEVEADRQLFVRDPQGYATMLMERAKRELQFFQTDSGIYVGDRGTGDVRQAARLPGKPQVYGDFVYVPEDAESAPAGLVAPSGPEPTPAWRKPGYQGTPPFVPDQGGPARPQAQTYREAIASIESRGSGDYAALGPVTRKGDRAYGRYQVMGANIPAWTEEVLGRRMTPQEFVASPEAQDAVFDAKFGGYVEQYGSPEEAASVWFTGRPLAQGANRRDQLGTSGAQYVRKFAQAAGGRPQLQGGAGADDIAGAPAIPGYRVIGRAKAGGEAKWRPDPQNPGFLINNNGDVKADPRVATAEGLKITDGDKKTTGFAYRTMQASKRLAALADRQIYKPRTPTAQLFDTSPNGVVRVVTKTQEDRLFIQAAKEWLAPVLRKDTGAAVTDQELATYMDIFIPRFEDGQEEMQQKAEARLDTMRALVNEAGPLYERTYGKPQYTSKYPQRRAPAKPAGKRPSLDSIFK
jgi:hypothetical protein